LYNIGHQFLFKKIIASQVVDSFVREKVIGQSNVFLPVEKERVFTSPLTLHKLSVELERGLEVFVESVIYPPI
jgi:hypothetical protein